MSDIQHPEAISWSQSSRCPNPASRCLSDRWTLLRLGTVLSSWSFGIVTSLRRWVFGHIALSRVTAIVTNGIMGVGSPILLISRWRCWRHYVAYVWYIWFLRRDHLDVDPPLVAAWVVQQFERQQTSRFSPFLFFLRNIDRILLQPPCYPSHLLVCSVCDQYIWSP